MVAAATLVHVMGQKKKCFASDCNGFFFLVTLLLEFVSTPSSFWRAFVSYVFKRNHSRRLSKFILSLSTELASLAEQKILFLTLSQDVISPSKALTAV